MTFHASCHCGAVRIEIVRKPRTLTECNCSICGRYAARWAYFTRKSVRVHSRPSNLVKYSTRNKTFVYYHCKLCGCVTHYTRVNTTRDDRIAVNVRMMDAKDLRGIPIRRLSVRRPQRTSRGALPRR